MGRAVTSDAAHHLTWSVVPVEDGKSEEGPVTVGGEGGFCQRSQVVHVVESRAVGVVVARQQQVDVVRRLEQEAHPELHPESYTHIYSLGVRRRHTLTGVS